ncbi:protein of unknown function [Shewanella benthica]|uniref:Uncharacterized protein n=1 Tax=Shewanella benthica TaxID=43661 RepID=A0A330M347_9GAMM|nr:protein of unknown function [Shewanella benthica]
MADSTAAAVTCRTGYLLIVNSIDPEGITIYVNSGTSSSVPYTIYVGVFLIFKGIVKIYSKYFYFVGMPLKKKFKHKKR